VVEGSGPEGRTSENATLPGNPMNRGWGWGFTEEVSRPCGVSAGLLSWLLRKGHPKVEAWKPALLRWALKTGRASSATGYLL
jgi:hypothetical protein